MKNSISSVITRSITLLSLFIGFSLSFAPTTNATCDDITLDNGQVWAGCDVPGEFNWDDAQSKCAKGYHLPSLEEIKSLQLTTQVGIISAIGIPDIPYSDIGKKGYWTSWVDLFKIHSQSWGFYSGYHSAAYYVSDFAINLRGVRCIKDAGTTTTATSHPPINDGDSITLRVGETKTYSFDNKNVVTLDIRDNNIHGSLDTINKTITITGNVPCNTFFNYGSSNVWWGHVNVIVSTGTTTTTTIPTETPSPPIITSDTITANPFAFRDQTLVATGVVVTSDRITITAISGSTDTMPISITGGEYQIDSGNWRSDTRTIRNGDSVTVRLTASASPSTKTSAILTIGGVSDSFDVTTVDAVNAPASSEYDITISAGDADAVALLLGNIQEISRGGGIPYLNNVIRELDILKGEKQALYDTAFTAYQDAYASYSQPITIPSIIADLNNKRDEAIRYAHIGSVITSLRTQVNGIIDRINYEASHDACKVGQGLIKNAYSFACSDCQYIPEAERNTLPTCATTQVNSNSGTWTSNNGIFGPGRPPNCRTAPIAGDSCNLSTERECVSTNEGIDTTYRCSAPNLTFYGRVIDAFGAPLPGVTIHMYSGMPLGENNSTVTDGNGKYFFEGSTLSNFLWFHEKKGYRQFRVGIRRGGSTGEQPDYTMEQPGPLTMLPAVQEIASQGGSDPRFTLGNFDRNDPNDMADLDICETTIYKDSNRNKPCEWLDYNKYQYNHSTHCTNCFTTSIYDHFLWSFKRDGSTDLQGKALTEIQSMKWEFRRKSNPDNVVSATLNLVAGKYTWHKERESYTPREGWDLKPGKCHSTATEPVDEGETCSPETANIQGAGYCAIDGIPSGGFTMWGCRLGNRTITDTLSITPDNQIISPITKNTVSFLVKNAKSTNIQACNEVILNPSVPNFTPENKCSGTSSNWVNFTGNKEWTFTTGDDGTNQLTGTFKYDATFGIPGLKTVMYFRKKDDISEVVSATLMVGQSGTSAGVVPYCGSNGLDLSHAIITCDNGQKRQSIDASICKPFRYNTNDWDKTFQNGEVITYTRTIGETCTSKAVSITPTNTLDFKKGSPDIIFTVDNLRLVDTEICYAVKEHPHNPNGAISGAPGCELESNWVKNWGGNSDWTQTINGWKGTVSYSDAVWNAKSIVVEMGFRSKYDRSHPAITTISTPR